jgi:hypothetical protein
VGFTKQPSTQSRVADSRLNVQRTGKPMNTFRMTRCVRRPRKGADEWRRGRRLSCRPTLERLEDRVMLAATITLNTTADSNIRDDVLTLREAI